MARCGCALKCSCVFTEGSCVKIDIDATAGDGCVSPTLAYVINVVPDNQTVFCGGNGLTATLNKLDTNTVDLEGIGTVGSPLEAHVIRTPDANVPDPDALGTGNLLKEIAGVGGGIYVSCEDIQDCVGAAIDVITSGCLFYDDANNTISVLICAEPNGVECAPAGDPDCLAGGLLVTPSSDADNSLTFGTDGRLFAPAAAVVPGDCMTFTGTGTPADPFVVTPLVAPEQNGVECVPGSGLLVTPSSDANNGVTFGGDTRLYINRCPLINGGAQVLVGNTGPCFDLVGGTDCTTPLVATLRISDDPCNGLMCGNDGLYVQVDDTNLPATIVSAVDFGPFGPFNGNFFVTGPAGNQFGVVVVGPTCVTITNPSPCRAMVVTALLNGFVDSGRSSGRFRVAFDVAESGNLAGPWFSVSQFGQSNPNSANSRITSNATWPGNDFTIPAGASHTECFRVQFNANNPALPVTNGRIFAGRIEFLLKGRWSQ